jgi:hypothetical protein
MARAAARRIIVGFAEKLRSTEPASNCINEKQQDSRRCTQENLSPTVYAVLVCEDD